MKKITLIAIACAGLISVPASAGTLTENIAKCAQVKDSLARLVCFDNLAKTVNLSVEKIQPNTPAIKAEVEIPKSVISKDASFGAEHLKKADVPEDELQVVFIVEKLKKDQYGKWRFTFKNGQQWKQTDSEHFRVKVGESLLLKKGFMDAVYLKKNIADSNKTIRVKRIK